MVVLVILSIFAVMVLPEFKGSRAEARLRGETEQLASMLRLANSQAVSTQAEVRLFVDQKKRRIFLEARDELGKFQPLDKLPGSLREFPEGIEIEIHPHRDRNYRHKKRLDFQRDRGHPDQLLFYPDGTTDPGELWIQDEMDFGWKLVVNSLTSRVQLLPFDGQMEAESELRQENERRKRRRRK